ncbi:hypothetical protein M407DRAFT_24322 [Tulasnella calospora MUT 4182]|uniref:Protein kinase domain-containing protein n=1 Tax=Tulasnella calospora MUT 4182 TaxID=1051891 RepID=A0A0C3QJJ5_9AGAM|nr:hypothetical protein M407DRAFT_24322 [Tulasnella calospora MUT 4182]
MPTSTTRVESVEPSHDAVVQMDLDPDQNQSGPQIPSAPTTMAQTLTDGVAPEPNAKKLTVMERLDRIPKYRIRSTAIRSTGKPKSGGKAGVVRASFKRNKGARGKRVAVKKLLWSDSMDNDKFSKEFVHEVELLSKLSHENVVQLVGFVEDFKHHKAWIVLAWEPNGNVREFLASGKWEIPERISLIKDMFRGLQYLHTREPPIRHGDLKSLNILVSSSYEAVITDFGSARLVTDNLEQEPTNNTVREASRVPITEEASSLHEVTVTASANQLTYTGPHWTLRWAAPEVVMGEKRLGLAIDIWSAAWVCWEMMTDSVPFEDINLECIITGRVVTGTVPLIHEDAQLAQIIGLCSLMKDCWRFKPEQRPRVSQCFTELQRMPSVRPLGVAQPGSKEPSPQLLLEMADLHYSHARDEKAASLLEQIVANAKSAGRQDVARALERLGDVHWVRGRSTAAEESYARAQEIYARIGNDHGRANTIRGLGDVYRAQSRYTEAEESYTRAQEIYARIGDDLGRASTMRRLGDVYHDQSRYTEAEESYTRAQEIRDRIGDDLGRANTILGLGEVYRAQRRYTEAEESYTRAQEIYARIGDDHGRANTMWGLGGVYSAQRRHTEAEESYTRALEIYARIGYDQGRANALDGLGDVHCAQCRYTEAEESYTRAQEIYARIGNDYGRANTMWGLGGVYSAQRRHTETEESYTRALEIYARIGDDQGRANA